MVRRAACAACGSRGGAGNLSPYCGNRRKCFAPSRPAKPLERDAQPELEVDENWAGVTWLTTPTQVVR